METLLRLLRLLPLRDAIIRDTIIEMENGNTSLTLTTIEIKTDLKDKTSQVLRLNVPTTTVARETAGVRTGLKEISTHFSEMSTQLAPFYRKHWPT